MGKIYVSDKKKKIVDTIACLVDENGLKNISIKQICKEADISIGTFYHYFESKDTIVYDMFEVLNEYFFDNEDFIRSQKTSKESAIFFAKSFGEFAEEWGYHANVLISSARVRKKLISIPDHDMWNILKSILEEAIEKGEISDVYDADFYTHSIKAIIRGSLLEWIYKKDDFNVTDTITKRVECFLN